MVQIALALVALGIAAAPAAAQGPCFLGEILVLDEAHAPVAGAEVAFAWLALRPGQPAAERWPPDGWPPDSAFTQRDVVGATDANGWIGFRGMDTRGYLVQVRAPDGRTGSARFHCPSSQRRRLYIYVRGRD